MEKPGRLSNIKSCADLSDADIDAALEREAHFVALFQHMGTLADPGEEYERVLVMLGRLAGAVWLDGDLRVEILKDGDRSIVELLTELGGGLRERVCAPVSMPVPFDGLLDLLELDDSLAEPLKVRSTNDRRLVLLASGVAKSTMPPPMVRVRAMDGTDHVHVSKGAPPRIPPKVPRPAASASKKKD